MKKDFSKIQFYFFLLLLLGVSIAFFWIIKPLIYPIFWAAVLAWIFHPLYKKISQHLAPHASLASFLAVQLIFLIIIIPASILTFIILRQSVELYNSSESEINVIFEKTKLLSQDFGDLSLIRFIDKTGIDWKIKIVEYTRALAGYVFSGIAGFTNGTIRFIVGFFIMLYALYYFLKDGESMIQRVFHISPLGGKSEKIISEKFTSVIRATMKGTFLVGLIQGVFAGIIFWIAGITAPLFWSLVMTILALIPSFGPALLGFPAGIVLLIQGKIWQGFFVLIFAAGFVSFLDNMIRPYFVGKDIHMHPLLVFFSTLGGLAVFGISGFVIGPIIASIFIALWTIYEHRFSKELKKN